MNQQPNKESLKTRLVKIDRVLNYKFACWSGHCPTPGEIQNNELKSLANRLKGRSYGETLTNILDWQERNIEFWTERHPLRSIFLNFVAGVIIIGSFVLLSTGDFRFDITDFLDDTHDWIDE